MSRMFMILVMFTMSWTSVAFAQTPAEALATYRQQYPTPMATAAQIGELLNRVAWEFRASGMKLLGKAGGANCPMPNGKPISCDYLVHGPSLTGHDVFQDAGPGGLTRPVPFTWGPGPEDLAGAISSGARTVVDPILPDSVNDPSVPGPITPNPGPSDPKLGTLLQQTLNTLRAEFNEEAIRAEQERVKAQAFRDAVGNEYKKFGIFVAKYVLPIVGGLIGGKMLFGGQTE